VVDGVLRVRVDTDTGIFPISDYLSEKLDGSNVLERTIVASDDNRFVLRFDDGSTEQWMRITGLQETSTD
jgi:hypothetical protein